MDAFFLLRHLVDFFSKSHRWNPVDGDQDMIFYDYSRFREVSNDMIRIFLRWAGEELHNVKQGAKNDKKNDHFDDQKMIIGLSFL